MAICMPGKPNLCHKAEDSLAPLELAASFSGVLSELDVAHEYVEVDDGHYDRVWDYTGVLQLMSQNLARD